MAITKDRQAQLAERVARQNRIDVTCVDPIWSPKVNVPQMELLIACPIQPNPVVLLPEMRFKTFLKMVLECLPPVGKLMIVDTVNTRFESIRNDFPNTQHYSLYYSAQTLSALNYSEGIFNAVLTQPSIPTLSQSERIYPEYARVMRPGARFVCATPLWGSFPQFFDILEECLLKLSPTEASTNEICETMLIDYQKHIMEQSHLRLDGSDLAEFEIEFESVEQLLFSTLIESNFLSYCLSIPLQKADPRQLLMLVVRAFHHYYQNESIRVPFKVAVLSAFRNENA